MSYQFIDTRNGHKYTYQTALEARAVARIAGMKLCQPRGWKIEDVRDCVAPPVPEPELSRGRGWLMAVLAVACAVVIGWVVHIVRSPVY